MAFRRLAVQPVHAHRAPRLDLGRLGLDQRDDVRDHDGVLYMVVGDARQIDHMLAVAAAGDADVGFARLAGAVDDAAEDRERHRGLDMLGASSSRCTVRMTSKPCRAQLGHDTTRSEEPTSELPSLMRNSYAVLCLKKKKNTKKHK